VNTFSLKWSMLVEKCRKRCIVRVDQIREIIWRMSTESRAENITCEFRDADGFEAAKENME